MKVIGNQRPSQAFGPCFDKQGLQTIKKIVPIVVVMKDGAAFDSTYDDVMQQTGDVDTCLSWHAERLTEGRLNAIKQERPLIPYPKPLIAEETTIFLAVAYSS